VPSGAAALQEIFDWQRENASLARSAIVSSDDRQTARIPRDRGGKCGAAGATRLSAFVGGAPRAASFVQETRAESFHGACLVRLSG